MRLLACLLLISAPGFARGVGQVRLAFHDGMEYIEARDLHADVKLLLGEREAIIELNHEKAWFKAPYGTYTLEVVAEGFRTYRRPIVISSKKVDLLIALQIGEIADYAEPPPLPQIEGRIVTENHDLSSLWVRVLPLFGRDGVTFDSRVDEDGRFAVVLNKGNEHCVVLVFAPGMDAYERPRLRVVWMGEVEAWRYLQIALE